MTIRMHGSESKDTQGMLEIITALSHEFGGPDYVQGGGGNTSCKDETTLWVKPSGTTLAALKPMDFTALLRKRIDHLFAVTPPADSTAREALVKELMERAMAPGAVGRPSVEAPLHHSFQARYVVHTHPAWINGLTCSQESAATAARLFPDALYIPFTDPGYTLCGFVRRAIETARERNGCEPRVILLENHGVFVVGDEPHEIRATYAYLRTTLEQAYAAAGLSSPLPIRQRPTPQRLAELASAIQATLGSAAASVLAEGSFALATGPLTPDHIVYQRSFPFEGEPTPEALRAFESEKGYSPRIVSLPDAILAVAPNEKSARLALDMALDGARVLRLTEAFGGVRYLSPKARHFIENWEVENYRQQVAGVA